jgi:coenzyme F420-0:L-glutamate ligase/coenzyme F420-1:gamma-L-glutamate ligase
VNGDSPRQHGADRLEVLPVDGVPEVRAGADLVDLLLESLAAPLQAGDVVVVSSKAIAKADGLTVRTPRERVIAEHTDRVVAVRGSMRVVRLPTGLTLAAAGVDESNTEPGCVVPLPPDPDESARDLRARLRDATGRQLAVVVTDTAGRPWRAGQTDLAVGVAGLVPLLDLSGTADAEGMPLRVTAPAIADEVAAAADLVRGKALGRPFAVVRGLGHLVTAGHGPGAQALLRSADDDLFGLGSRDAVRAAVRRDDPASSRGFPAPGPLGSWLPELLADAARDVEAGLVRCTLEPAHVLDTAPDTQPDARQDGTVRVTVSVPAEPLAQPGLEAVLAAGALGERVRVLAAARRARVVAEPAPPVREPTDWRVVQVLHITSDSAS